MSEKVVPIHGIAFADVPVDVVLDEAKDSNFKQVVVIGQTRNGEICLMHSSASVPESNWMIDHAKQELLFGEDYED